MRPQQISVRSVLSYFTANDPLAFRDFDFNNSVFKDFKDFFNLRDRGKLLQYFTVLSAEVRPGPLRYICKRGTINLNYNTKCFLSGRQSLFLEMRLCSQVKFH